MAENLSLLKEEALSKLEVESWTKTAKDSINGCPKIKKEREIKILESRFGIGKTPKTLQAIGLEYGLTRERIRQIAANAAKKIQKSCASKEAKKRIQEVETTITRMGGFSSLVELAKILKITDKKEINALNFICALSGNLIQLKESQELRQGWHTKKVKGQNIKNTAKKAADIIKREGKVVSAKKLSEALDEEPNLTESILRATKTIMETEDKKWGLSSWPHINPKSIKDKSKYILKKHGKPLHYSELTDMIAGVGNKNVTKQSVHNELIKNVDFVLIGRGIYALSEWGYAPGIVEEVIVTVLEEAGEPLHKSDIVQRVMEKRIVKESTIVLNLQKKRFKRVAKAIYTLN